jgi:hypothetical protein
MNEVFSRHFTRLSAGISKNRIGTSDYITRYTFLGAKRFSFDGHEYQRYILDKVDTNSDTKLLLYKSSQLGVSELFHRLILALMGIEPGFSTLLGMPSQTFSQEVMKTRIAQIIRSSKVLKELSNPQVDSASVKQFLNGSILYALGAGEQSGSSSLINRPIKLVCIDELDRCSIDIVTGFLSRQTHSVFKPCIYISTPTYEGLGIDGESEDAEIHRNIVKCDHCGHGFFPDYYENVHLPGFDQPLELLTRSEIESNPSIRIDEAQLLCPNCLKSPDLTPEHREFVVETPQKSTLERKICIKLSPFDAPSRIKVPNLIRASFSYSDNNEFRNQALGLPVKASDSSIDRNLLRFENIEVPSDAVTVVGLDMGKLCHLIRLSITPSNHIIVHSPEIIPLSLIPETVKGLFQGGISNQHITSMVVDSLPYTDTVNKLLTSHPQAWSALYTVPMQPKPELYWLKTEDEPESNNSNNLTTRIADYKVRQITINKNPFFDYAAGLLQSEQLKFKSGTYDLQVLNHILDMRRVRDYRYSEIRFKWVKSKKGADHFFHAIIYAISALKLIDTAAGSVLLPRVLLQRLKVKEAI